MYIYIYIYNNATSCLWDLCEQDLLKATHLLSCHPVQWAHNCEKLKYKHCRCIISTSRTASTKVSLADVSFPSSPWLKNPPLHARSMATFT